jgi:hypothetical protein
MWWFFFIYHTGDLYIRAINFRVRKTYVAIFVIFNFFLKNKLTIATISLSFFSGSYKILQLSSSVSSLIVIFHAIFKSNELLKVRRITTEEDTSSFEKNWDPENITLAHKMNKEQDLETEVEMKRNRQKQIRNRIREKYGLNQ